MNTRRGAETRLRAICRRCCMPPEKVRGRSSMRSGSISTCSSQSSPAWRSQTVVAHALGHQPFADVGAGGHAHAQAVARVLLDEAPLGAQQGAPLGFAGGVEVQPAVAVVAVGDRAGVRRTAPGEQRAGSTCPSRTHRRCPAPRRGRDRSRPPGGPFPARTGGSGHAPRQRPVARVEVRIDGFADRVHCASSLLPGRHAAACSNRCRNRRSACRHGRRRSVRPGRTRGCRRRRSFLPSAGLRRGGPRSPGSPPG